MHILHFYLYLYKLVYIYTEILSSCSNLENNKNAPSIKMCG